MRIFFLPDWSTIVLIFLLWPLFQLLPIRLARRMKDGSFYHGSPFYRSRAWERSGEIYDSLFRIRAWKHLLPDGAAVTKKGYRKRHLSDFTQSNLEKFLLESCRGEFGHWLAIPPFLLFGLFLPPGALPLMFAYALLVNLPCIMAQRFNRPRIARILEREFALFAKNDYIKK